MACGRDVAVIGGHGAGEVCRRGDAAPVAGMQGHVVAGLLVHAFDDVNFAVVGPVGADEPATSYPFVREG